MDAGSFTDIQFMYDDMEMYDIATEVMLDSSSSSEEDGGKRERAPNKDRNFVLAYEQQIVFYFSGPDSVYNEADFERRFQCPRSVFNRVHDAMVGKHPFIHYMDAAKKPGIFPLVKLVGCFCYLAYGDAVDREDENLQIGESTLDPIIKDFTRMMVEEFGG